MFRIEKIYTAKEVIKILHITKPTLYQRIENGEIKAYKEGSHYRFEEKDIREYIKKQKENCKMLTSKSTGRGKTHRQSL